MVLTKKDLFYLIYLKEWLHILGWSQKLLIDNFIVYIFKYLYIISSLSGNLSNATSIIVRMKKQPQFFVKNTLYLSDFLVQRNKIQFAFILKRLVKTLMTKLKNTIIYSFKDYQKFLLSWYKILPSLKEVNFLFFTQDTMLPVIKSKFFINYFLFGDIKSFFKRKKFHILKRTFPFLRFEFCNLGEVFKFRLFNVKELRILQVLRLQNFFRYTFFGAKISLKKICSGISRVAKTKPAIFSFLIKRLNFYVFKRRCAFWNKYKLRNFGSLYLGWYLFAYYLKISRRDKLISDFLYRFLRKLRRGYLRDSNWMNFSFFWDYSLRWHFDSYYYFDVILKKEIHFFKYFYVFSVLQAESLTSFNFLFQVFKNLVIVSRDSFFLHRRKHKNKLNLKKFLLFWKKKFVKIFIFNMFLGKALNQTEQSPILDSNKLILSSGLSVTNSMFFTESNRAGLFFVKNSFETLITDYRNGHFLPKRSFFLSELHQILMLLQVVSHYTTIDSSSNSLIELHQRLNVWLSEKTVWFNLIAKIIGLRYYRNLDVYCLKTGMVKIIKLRRSWASWRLFKSNVFSFRRGKPIKFFFKCNRFLVRYYNFFYNYKFNLLKKNRLRGFIGLLECKLEVLIYRLGFVTDIISAKTYVRDVGALVDDTKVHYSHYIVKVGSILRASRDLWGKLLWRLNFGTSVHSRSLMPYLEMSYRLYGCCLLRLPFPNELYSKFSTATTKKPFMKWLFWLS